VLGVYIYILFIIIFCVILVSISFIDYYFQIQKWKNIEQINYGFGINRRTAFIDNLGYLRWKKDNKLCHREIAYNYIYKKNWQEYKMPFSKYEVHHKNKNKLDCKHENLEILDRENHRIRHGEIIFYNNRKFIRVARERRRYVRTKKAILIAGRWIPLSQIIFRHDWIYLADWCYKKKFEPK